MGVLWLSTVPPTNATIAQIFGVRTCRCWAASSSVSHQIGSFLGVWLGGLLYDAPAATTSSGASPIALGVFAALVNLPVRETPIARAGAGGRHEAARRAGALAHGQRRLALLAGGVRAVPQPDMVLAWPTQLWACF